MKTLFGFFLLVLFQFSSFSTGSSLSQAELIAALPKCALTCLVTALSNSTCKATDQQCICTNVPLNEEITQCVSTTCTIREALATKNVSSVACDAPIRDQRSFYNTVSNVMGSISGGAVILRLLSRYLSDAEFGMDDYTIVMTLISGAPSSVINAHLLTPNGLGTDLWKVPFDQITEILRLFYAMEILYFLQVGLIKASILFFYLRIFPGDQIRKVIHATVIFNVLYTFAFIMIAVFQCRPISYSWDKWDGEHKGTCLNNNGAAFANAGISIFLDVWMLALPLTQLISLNLHWKKKVGVAMMFSVGLFVTIISIIRLPKLVVLSRSLNPSWDYIQVGFWSTLEINIAIICACMPNLRVLLIRIFPRALGTTRDKSMKYLYSRDTERHDVSSSHHRNMARNGNGILTSKTYAVDYNDAVPERENSQVELVKLRPDGGKVSITIERTVETPHTKAGDKAWR